MNHLQYCWYCAAELIWAGGLLALFKAGEVNWGGALAGCEVLMTGGGWPSGGVWKRDPFSAGGPLGSCWSVGRGSGGTCALICCWEIPWPLFRPWPGEVVRAALLLAGKLEVCKALGTTALLELQLMALITLAIVRMYSSLETHFWKTYSSTWRASPGTGRFGAFWRFLASSGSLKLWMLIKLISLIRKLKSSKRKEREQRLSGFHWLSCFWLRISAFFLPSKQVELTAWGQLTYSRWMTWSRKAWDGQSSSVMFESSLGRCGFHSSAVISSSVARRFLSAIKMEHNHYFLSVEITCDRTKVLLQFLLNSDRNMAKERRTRRRWDGERFVLSVRLERKGLDIHKKERIIIKLGRLMKVIRNGSDLAFKKNINNRRAVLWWP